MPQPYLRPLMEIDFLRGPGIRDDNFNVGWTIDAGVGIARDGDILTISGTTGTNGFNQASWSTSSTTNPYFVTRVRSSDATTRTLDFKITFSDTTTQTFTITCPPNKYSVVTNTLTSGKTVNACKLLNQNIAGSILVDYVAVCANTPIILTKQDLDPIVISNSTNTVDDVTFNLRNTTGKYTVTTPINLYDTLYVYLGYIQDDTTSWILKKRFGGVVTELSPDQSQRGDILKIHAQGWAQALLNVYSLKEYGSQSFNSSINTMTGAISDIITNVNLGGYQLTTNYIQSFANNSLTYIIFKTEPSFNCIKQLCDILTTNNDPAGTSTQPVEFWVDVAENCHLAPLGAWGSDPNPSTYPNALNVGTEHITNSLTKDMQHLVNQVHFWSITIRPPDGDYWTETQAANVWGFTSGATGGSSSGPSYDSSTGNVRVGTNSLTASWTGATTGSLEADIYYPDFPNHTLQWDITKLGGRIVPPVLKFYAKCNQTVYAPQVRCMTSHDGITDGFYGEPLPIGTTGLTNSDWHLWQYALGPYGDKFTKVGNADWTNINHILIGFQFTSPKVAGQVWIDGLRVDGQTHYVAKNSTKIGQYGLREAHLVNHKIREASELQLLAKAELFRSQKPVLRGTITVPGIPDVLPGQKVTVTAPSANLTAATLRILEARHRFGTGEGYVTELDLTDDLTNYQALSPVSLSNMLLDMPISKTQKRRDEYNIGLEKPDPTNATTTVDYPS